MSKDRRKLRLLVAKHKIFIICWLISSILWSWLWLIDAARISQQRLIPYLIIGLVFFLITGLSALVFSRTIMHLALKYRQKPGVLWLLYTIVIWAFAEALVAWLVAFIWIGRNGSISNVLPFDSLTPFVMYTPLRFLSRFVGFHGLSAIVVVGAAVLILKNVKKYALAYWATVAMLTFFSWLLYKTPNGVPTRVTVIAETLEHKLPVNSYDSKLIILPEYGLDDSVDVVKPQRFMPTDSIYYYVGSKLTNTPIGHTNVLVFGNSKDGNIQHQAKNRLIPGGEHLSYGVEMALGIFSPTTLSDFKTRREVLRGTKSIIPYFIDNDLIVGAGVCSSTISTRDYRQLAKKGATILSNSASLEIFEGSRLFRWQQLGLSTFMATANARPFLQSTNNWPAYALDNNGRQVMKALPISQKQGIIITNNRNTPYTILGEWPVWVGAIITLFHLARLARMKSPKKLK